MISQIRKASVRGTLKIFSSNRIPIEDYNTGLRPKDSKYLRRCSSVHGWHTRESAGTYRPPARSKAPVDIEFHVEWLDGRTFYQRDRTLKVHILLCTPPTTVANAIPLLQQAKKSILWILASSRNLAWEASELPAWLNVQHRTSQGQVSIWPLVGSLPGLISEPSIYALTHCIRTTWQNGAQKDLKESGEACWLGWHCEHFFLFGGIPW